MPIALTRAQAEKVAELARSLGGEISLHQLSDGRDLYVGPAGGEHQFLVSASGDASEVEEPPPAADVA